MENKNLLIEKQATYIPNIDWHSQWANSGAKVCDGYFEIPLQKAIKGHTESLKMLAGAGFCDLSHPTTILTLKLMAPLVKDRCFVDIGSGSGILSLAAAKLAAKQIIGIEIDPLAIQHAELNAAFNKLSIPYSFTTAEKMPALPDDLPLLMAMNMIYSEQELAWHSLSKLHNKGLDCITSGILQEHKDHYLNICQKWGWRLNTSIKQGKWLAFHFTS